LNNLIFQIKHKDERFIKDLKKRNMSVSLMTVLLAIITVTLLFSILIYGINHSNEFFSLNFAFAQTEANSSVPSNQTLKVESTDQERLPFQEDFSSKLLTSNLTAPHNIIYGPDNALWITERIGKNITRVDAETGGKLSSTPVPNVLVSGGQDGLMGMVFDPQFNNNHQIYVVYTYDADPTDKLDRLTKITRFTYDISNNTLSQPVDLISGLAGSVDHNSGRLTFGLDGKLYYTIGDQGKNQLSEFCSNNEAQHLPTAQQVAAKNWDTYEGKVLRMNPDGSIPDDNPVLTEYKVISIHMDIVTLKE